MRIRQLRAGRTSTGRGSKPATPRATRWRGALAIRSEMTAFARNEQRFDVGGVAAPEVKQPPSHGRGSGRGPLLSDRSRRARSLEPTTPSWRTSRPVPASAEHSCLAVGIVSSATSPRSKQSSASSTIGADGHGAWGTAPGPGTIGFVTTLGGSVASRRARCGMHAMARSARCVVNDAPLRRVLRMSRCGT
jgi:hypothetical protein